jgi:hypothetical protein
MRMSLNDSRAPMTRISASAIPPLLANVVYPAVTHVDIEYFRPSATLRVAV